MSAKPCQPCGGCGTVPDPSPTGWVVCPACGGTGRTQPRTPTAEQLAALRRYASAHGRNWKSALLNDWATGRDADVPYLRQIRNAFGPSWLVTFRFAPEHV